MYKKIYIHVLLFYLGLFSRTFKSHVICACLAWVITKYPLHKMQNCQSYIKKCVKKNW